LVLGIVDIPLGAVPQIGPEFVRDLVKVKQVFEKGFASAAPCIAIPVPLLVVIVIRLISPGGALPRAIQDLVELSTVEPDPATLWAVIYFNTLPVRELELHHTCRT
jgi:hypothetical protein